MKPSLLIFALSLLLGGCASLFQSTPPRALLDGPPEVQALDQDGRLLRVHSEGSETYVYPSLGTDSVTLEYRGHRHTVGLAKHTRPWTVLDLASEGLGFVIDDMGGTWFNYNAIYVRTDTTGGDFAVSSTNWLGEPAGHNRPELLLTGGFGITANVHPLSGEAGAFLFPVSYAPTFSLSVEGGIGIDLYKKIELFYQGCDNPAYELAQNEFYPPTADIGSTSIAVRYFVHHDLYGQLSFGYGRAQYDSAVTGSDQIISSDSRHFPIIGVGLGWAGDISYLSLEFRTALSPFQVGYFDPLYYREITLNMGLNFRF